jgi:ribosomal protein L5
VEKKNVCFLDRLITSALPRVRISVSGIKATGFDGRNYNLVF